MPAIMIERPKMTRTMYQALKRHIMKERERKKQEQAQDEELEKQRKEQELRRKKEAEDSLTLEQTKDQITSLESKLEVMKQDKHGLFSQLKKVLHQEDESRKRAQEKEHNEMVASMQQQQQYAGMAPSGSGSQQHMYLPSQMSKYMNVSTIQQHRAAMFAGQKRQRSPSPTPPSHTTVYSQYPPNKYQAAAYSSSAKQAYTNPKTVSSYPTPSTHATYASQSGHTYGQAGLYPGGAGPGGKYSSGQSAFSTYPSHYAHQQQIKEHSYPPQQFPVSRLPHQAAPAQPPVRGYLAGHSGGGALPGHGSHGSGGMPLPQQLEHANKKSGFAEDKYKLMRGMQHHQASAAPVGGISSGFPIRTQASSSSQYPQPSQSVVSSSQQHAYAQHQRYYR